MKSLPGAYGIEAASHYLPARADILDWAQGLGVDPQNLSALQRNGMRHFHRAGAESVEDMAALALASLIDQHPFDVDEIGLLVFVHSLQTSTPAAPASLPARLVSRFGLRRAQCFSMAGQNCASLLAALRTMASLFGAEPALGKVLLVTADRCCGELYRDVGAFSFESDGASALLLSRHCPVNRVLCCAGHVDGRHHGGFRRPQARLREYQTLYGLVTHRLISKTVRMSGMTLDDFQHLLPINLDRHVFERLATSLRMPPDWVFTDNIAAHGHVMCSDFVLNMATLWQRRGLSPHDNLLCFMSGNNGSFATVALGDCHPLGPNP